MSVSRHKPHRNWPNPRKAKIQAKHIPAVFLLELLDHLVKIPHLTTWQPWLYTPSTPHPIYVRAQVSLNRTQVCEVWPEIPEKVIIAKLRNLIRKGFVEGCVCGCRGDFHLTNKGKTQLREFRLEQSSSSLIRPDFLVKYMAGD